MFPSLVSGWHRMKNTIRKTNVAMAQHKHL
jgi:hypothetical protein